MPDRKFRQQFLRRKTPSKRQEPANHVERGNAFDMEALAQASFAETGTGSPWSSSPLSAGAFLEAFAGGDPRETGLQHGRSGLSQANITGEPGDRSVQASSVDGKLKTWGRSWATEDSQRVQGFAVTADDQDVSLAVGDQSVSRRDEDGSVRDGSETGARMGTDGFGFQGAKTEDGVTKRGAIDLAFDRMAAMVSRSKGGVTGAVGAGVSKDGRVDLSASLGKKKGPKVSGTLAFGNGQTTVGANLGFGGAGVGAKISTKTDQEAASLDRGSSDASGMLGESTVGFSSTDGTSASGSLKASHGIFGAGVTGGTTQHDSVEAHTTVENLLADLAADPEAVEKASHYDIIGVPAKEDLSGLDAKRLTELAQKNPAVFRALAKSQLSMRLDGIDGSDGFSALHAASLTRVGEAISMTTGEGSAMGASLTAGLTASFGISEHDVQQLTIARTADDEWTVRLNTTSSESLKGSVGIPALTLSAENGESDSAGVEFTVKGTDGLEALGRFQKTGILPGAEKLPQNQAGLKQAQALREEIAGVDQTSLRGQWKAAQLDAKLRGTLGRMNAGILSTEQDLPELSASVDGITYDHAVKGHTESDTHSLDLLGSAVMKGGSKHTRTDKQYVENKKKEFERGASAIDPARWSPDATSSISLNPQDSELFSSNGEPLGAVEFLLTSDQSMDSRQREIVDGTGALSAEPDTLVRGYVDGSYTDASTTAIKLAWTKDQLEMYQTATAKAPGIWGENATSSMGGFLSKSLKGRKGISPMMGSKDMDNRHFAGSSAGLIDDLAAEWGIEMPEALLSMGYAQEEVTEQFAARAEALGEVDSPEAFGKLSENEQRLALVSRTMASIEGGGDPWSAVTMAMSVEDGDLRNRHLRELFDVIERRKVGMHASVDFIEHLQTSPHLAEVRPHLMATFRAEMQDTRVDSRAAALAESPDAAADIARGLEHGDTMFSAAAMRPNRGLSALTGEPDALMRDVGDDTVDWLLAAREAGGPELVRQGLRGLIEKRPGAMERILERVQETEPARAKVLEQLFEEAAVQQWNVFLDANG